MLCTVCTVDSVLCTVYSPLSTVYTVNTPSALQNVECVLCSIKFTLHNVPNAHFALYNVYYIIQYTVCTVYNNINSV